MINAPSQLDFLAAFGVEPEAAHPTDGQWMYKFDGPDGTVIRFSFDTFTRSVQARVLLGENTLSVVVRERATEIRIDGDSVYVSFDDPGARLTLQVFPFATVQFSDIVV